MTGRQEVRQVYVYNESVSYETYRAFDGLIRTSKLRDVAGTITLSIDAATLEMIAAFRSPSSSLPDAVAQAKTVEGLFAEVLSMLTSAPPAA